MIISLIVAVDENGGIGKNNRLPWHLPSDLKRFKKLTMGHHLIMGRKTFETIGRALPGRATIILTRQEKFQAQGCAVVHSLSEALHLAQDDHETEVFVIGGGEIFHQAFGLAERIYLTRVHGDFNADVFFPEIEPEEWLEKKVAKDEDNGDEEIASEFVLFERKDWGIDKTANPHIIRQTLSSKTLKRTSKSRNDGTESKG